jgi:hypothetical protein
MSCSPSSPSPYGIHIVYTAALYDTILPFSLLANFQIFVDILKIYLVPKIGLSCSKITSCRQVVGANLAQIGKNPA